MSPHQPLTRAFRYTCRNPNPNIPLPALFLTTMRTARAGFSSHEILRPFPALRGLPVDILRRDLDVACFAMNATGCKEGSHISPVYSSQAPNQIDRKGTGITYFCALIWNLTPTSRL